VTTLGTNEAASTLGRSRTRVAGALAVGCLLALVVVKLLATAERWSSQHDFVLARGTGWLALALLAASLVTTPVARIMRRLGRAAKSAPVWRRALGMAAAWLALAHAASALSGVLHWEFAVLGTWPHLRAGLAALLTLALLLATSFTRVVVLLRLAFFKELHRLAYMAALLTLVHLLTSPFAPRALTLGLFSLIFLLGLARFL
jgi:methionine sulfoxide reductase heme-binding subunit